MRSAKGEMIPLSSLATVKYPSGPDALDRFNNPPAVKIIGQGAPGVSSGQAIARIEQIATEVLPSDFSWARAYEEEALAIFVALDDEIGEAIGLGNLGEIAESAVTRHGKSGARNSRATQWPCQLIVQDGLAR